MVNASIDRHRLCRSGDGRLSQFPLADAAVCVRTEIRRRTAVVQLMLVRIF